MCGVVWCGDEHSLGQTQHYPRRGSGLAFTTITVTSSLTTSHQPHSTASSMSDKQDAQRPFYLREDSSDESSGDHTDGEGGVGGGESGKGGPEMKPNWPWKRRGNDKGKGKEGDEGDGDDEREGRKSSEAERERDRQAKVGRVEVDPAISA